MNYSKFLSLFILIIVLVSACSYPKEWKKVETKHFCMEFPPYTDKMVDISAQEAELEWGSFFKNFYIVVRKQPIQDLKELAESTKNKLLENDNLFKPRFTDFRELEINDQKAIEWIVRGGIGREALREEITYYHYFVESPGRMYELIIWNWTKRDEEFKADIDRIVNSFKGIKEGC